MGGTGHHPLTSLALRLSGAPSLAFGHMEPLVFHLEFKGRNRGEQVLCRGDWKERGGRGGGQKESHPPTPAPTVPKRPLPQSVNH